MAMELPVVATKVSAKANVEAKESDGLFVSDDQ